MTNGDSEGRIFLSNPNTHHRFLYYFESETALKRPGNIWGVWSTAVTQMTTDRPATNNQHPEHAFLEAGFL